MGLFSFVGKAIGGLAKTALGIIPGGGIAKTALGIAGHLLAHKSPMQSPAQKINVASRYNPALIRGRTPNFSVPIHSAGPAVLRATPTMPGGSVATSQGIMASGGGAPPMQFSGTRSSSSGRRKRSGSPKRKGKKRSGGGRKLKFGSPAWRKKYMRKRR